MKKQFIYIGLLLLVMISAYGLAPNYHPSIQNTKDTLVATKVQLVLNYARTYIGTPHRYGGHSKKGIDCSGLVFLSFESIDIKIPRSSADMAEIGSSIALADVQPGDIVLFTYPGGTRISHSGIVSTVNGPDDIQFIHTSSSKGVIEESMLSKYWAGNYVMARRVIE